MRWFGRDWGAPICEETEHATRPEGACQRCKVPFREGDDGIIIPTMVPIREDGHIATSVAYHLDCFLAAVGVRGLAPTFRGPRPQ